MPWNLRPVELAQLRFQCRQVNADDGAVFHDAAAGDNGLCDMGHVAPRKQQIERINRQNGIAVQSVEIDHDEIRGRTNL